MTRATPNALEPRGVIEDPWSELRRFSPARIALGRSGSSLPTRQLLEFGLAHAHARDAVHASLAADTILAQLAALDLSCVEVRSAARDRAHYLLRPDLGRSLSAEGLAALERHANGHPGGCDLALVVADGLSALAVERNAVDLCAQILRQAPAGWRIGPVVLAHQARVALGDACGHLLGARMVAVLIGERPGLSTPDSLGVYLTHAPRPDLTDADRNCISNIHRHGLTPAQAAGKLWWLAGEARRIGQTGVGLKDTSDAPQLA